MKNIDHKLLGHSLSEKYLFGASAFERKMFCLGCIMPDKNPGTYLKGSRTYQRFHGHNYLNAKNMVGQYMYMLSEKITWSFMDYYRLGKVIHYVTDAFTYPHNKEFKGSIKQHRKYEENLHREFLLERRFEDKINVEQDVLKECILFEKYKKLHQQYLVKRQGMIDDLRYIHYMVENVMNYEKNFFNNLEFV